MSVLRSLLQVLVGTTRVVPLGVAALVLAGLALRALAPELWSDAGGLLLLAGVAAVLVLAGGRRG